MAQKKLYGLISMAGGGSTPQFLKVFERKVTTSSSVGPGDQDRDSFPGSITADEAPMRDLATTGKGRGPRGGGIILMCSMILRCRLLSYVVDLQF